MAFSPVGNMAVSRTSAGVITILEVQDGKVVNQYDYLKNLRKPHGLAFDSSTDSELFYYAEEDKISFVSISSTRIPQKIADLPKGGGHFTRTLGFGPDKRLYVSIGSSCNVCIEKDERRAKIFSMNKDGSDFKEFARGLRNAVFFTWHPKTQKMWATEMGRDLIGDDIPPDEINIVEEGNPSTGLWVKNYGWPNCYGQNVHDTDFDKNTYIRNPCMEPFETSSYIDIPAHSAPLGLAFIPASDPWSKEYWNNLLVSYHGSWNRTTPTGYKVVRYKLDENGNYQGAVPAQEDFITGWLTPLESFSLTGQAPDKKEALGRPVDIVIHENAIYISDDKAGVIYKITIAKSSI